MDLFFLECLVCVFLVCVCVLDFEPVLLARVRVGAATLLLEELAELEELELP